MLLQLQVSIWGRAHRKYFFKRTVAFKKSDCNNAVMCCIEPDPLSLYGSYVPLCECKIFIRSLPRSFMKTFVAFSCLEWSRKCGQKGLQLDATAGGPSKSGPEDRLQGEMMLFGITAVFLLAMLRLSIF